jgi:hypothetical protein
MPQLKEFYHDVDLKANQLFNSRVHNITTASRTTLGASLSTSSKGYMVYDTDLSSPYFWDGVQWQKAVELPSQSGNNGKLLTTNVSVVSWADLPTPPAPPDPGVISISAGTGMSFSTITSTGSVAIDTTKVPYYSSGFSTGFAKYNGSAWVFDTNTYLTSIISSDVTTALGYTPVTNARTITINGTNYDLTANRSWSVGTVTSVATAGLISGGPITTSGTITTSMNTGKLVGRSGAGTGVMEEITVGTGLSLSGGTLNATAQSVGFEQNFLLMGA